MFSLENKILELESIYKQIHCCSRCVGIEGGSIKFDEKKVQKQVFRQYLTSEVFMVGQSLASNQVRISGIPFHNLQNEISRGGKFLEKSLNRIGYTLSPQESNYRLAYMSDIVQCYPGKKENGTGDNIPNIQEIKNCREWLLKELELIGFRVLLLLGSQAARTFFEFFKGERIKNASEYYSKQENFRINNVDIPVFILPHQTSRVKDRSEIYHTTFSLIQDKLAR
jgi:uracil-DNA glycosylase family 4